MKGDRSIQSIEQMVQKLISDQPDLFLVEISLDPANNVKVYIDGDRDVTIEKLAGLNRKLYAAIEESGIFPSGDFSLEVSSPGLDKPLKLHRQYLKNIGRFAEVLDKEGVKKEGKLVNVTDRELTLEVKIKGKGKKTETALYTVLFENIKTTKIQIKL